MLTRKQFFFISVGTALAGCGGGGGDESNSEAPITPKVRVKWPALSRAFEATPYAMSVRVTLLNAKVRQSAPFNPIGGDVVIIGNRSGEAAYEAEYVASELAGGGFTRVQVEFFADPNALGRQLLLGFGEVNPDPNGFLPDITFENGSGAFTEITLSYDTREPLRVNRFFTVVISTGTSNPFAFPGINLEDYHWEIVSSDAESGPVLEVFPQAGASTTFRALRAGTATVTLTIDGIKSKALSVVVEPAISN